MEHYSKTELKSIFPLINTNKKIEYFNVAASFDIETSSIYQGGTKIAFSYIWMLAIGDEYCCYGRTWEEFAKVLEDVKIKLDLNINKRLIIYVHNLGYEFQFMKHYFDWETIFSLDERKPVKAVTKCGIEFKCSYILSGYSLANVAKNLTNKSIKKLDGDLDYSLTRTNSTPLTELELSYCENDVKIIIHYINEQIDLYGDITKLPLTNTGRVRTYVRNNCYYSSSNHRKSSKGKYIKYRKIMTDLTIDVPTYTQLKRAFMGGFTHANYNKVGEIHENVSSIDFTSSYPSVMLAEQFPMSRFKPITLKNYNHLLELCDKFCLIMDVKFKNISATLSHENYISESKCFVKKGTIINNGRIFQAEEIQTTITEIDFSIINKTYSWDEIEVTNVKYAHKNYLPKPIIESILKLYEDKTVLKDVEGYEVEYMLSKGMLNSIYGMCVTDIVKDETIFNLESGWDTVPANPEEAINQYNSSKNRFLYYPWGVWVTAYARRNLWTGILAVGEDYIYSDTDSLKLTNYESHSKYIEWFNSDIVNKMIKMCNFHKIDPEKLSPKTKDGKVKTLGIWDYEGTYTRFKTLGAKRYIIEEGGKLKITVAGLSKQNGINYLLEKYGDNSEVLNAFDDNLYIPANKTGKMTHTYIDDEYKILVTDYLGNKERVKTLSGIHLDNCEFTLKISSQFNKFLSDYSNGYKLAKGKYI